MLGPWNFYPSGAPTKRLRLMQSRKGTSLVCQRQKSKLSIASTSQNLQTATSPQKTSKNISWSYTWVAVLSTHHNGLSPGTYKTWKYNPQNTRLPTIATSILQRSTFIEHEVILRQLLMEDTSSSSWTIQLRNVLFKYMLPTALQLANDPASQWPTR